MAMHAILLLYVYKFTNYDGEENLLIKKNIPFSLVWNTINSKDKLQR